MKFYIALESIKHDIIKEGGNAVPNVNRIKKEDIDATIENFKNEILIPVIGKDPADDLFTLGSTGKKPDSGDIDLAINSNILNSEILYSLLKFSERCASCGYVNCINTFTYDMLHVAYPQNNKKINVQIDLLLTEYPDFAKFFMYSPSNIESKYKGAHRNEVMHSILYTISYKPIQKDSIGNVVKWSQYDINNKGLFLSYKTLVDDDGNYLKYKDTNENLEELYAKDEKIIPISHDVRIAIDKIFGNDFNIDDIDTFEKCLAIVQNNEDFKYKKFKVEIINNLIRFFKEKEKRLVFPDELNNEEK